MQQPAGLLGIYTNMPATVPANISKALASNEAPSADLTADERNVWNQLDSFNKSGLGYAIEMNNRPQTLYGIVDSPVGLAVWMIDHDARSQEMIARVPDGALRMRLSIWRGTADREQDHHLHRLAIKRTPFQRTLEPR